MNRGKNEISVDIYNLATTYKLDTYNQRAARSYHYTTIHYNITYKYTRNFMSDTIILGVLMSAGLSLDA